ncbi:4Fe-4S binding protein [Carboxylicivirga sp. N1Y90]|uniref:ATP-binding protein n=1 Tax=Carboxylicivirga fragile TaxID=3417571 RepID=UPI003D358ABF|nr:4Fe-4S binding protein [Marinilabiliaceae bacterium N1Y90]
MHEITILSGKGGTGKTTITAAFSSLAESVVICDSDVDAADLFLIMQPEVKQQDAFISGWKCTIESTNCIQCGQCVTQCRFNAIIENKDGRLAIDPFACEGCRLCERICPQQAIVSTKNSGNTWFESETRFGPFIHAQMGVGEENSGKLVSFIRKKAKEKAIETSAQYIISDGPPGIGCPVIASITGAKQVLLVIEPSQSGWHDASRLINLIKNFKVSVSAIINKAGIHQELELVIKDELEKLAIPVLGEVPFSMLFRHAMIEQKNIIEYAPKSSEAEIIRSIWKALINTDKVFKLNKQESEYVRF